MGLVIPSKLAFYFKHNNESIYNYYICVICINGASGSYNLVVKNFLIKIRPYETGFGNENMQMSSLETSTIAKKWFKNLQDSARKRSIRLDSIGSLANSNKLC